MSDKKIIIIAVILALILIGAGWFYSKNKPSQTPAAISDAQTDSSVQKTPGITLGNENAPVTIEEYTNFLCSHCATFALQTLPKIEQDYIATGKVKMVIYILPPYELARAGYCANQAGKFLEFEDYIFNHQADIKQAEDVIGAAKNMGLGDSFEQCYNSDAAKTAGQDWNNRATENKIEGTPTFFINGEQIVGAVPYEDFQKAIDSKLK
jgi:protein-disulfide isomerase